MRMSKINRVTAETQIKLELNLDGCGKSEISTGCGFLDHMLTLFSAHGKFDLIVKCTGDYNVDFHHTTEDVGICLGQAFLQSLGDKRGINRYGSTVLPMDEALILTAADISGRACLSYELNIPTQKVGEFDCELVKEFWLAFVREAKISLHIRQICGENSHHIIEGAFKSAARTLRAAVSIDEKAKDEIPSTKGVL